MTFLKYLAFKNHDSIISLSAVTFPLLRPHVLPYRYSAICIYLIGARHAARTVFSGIAWSTSEVLSTTLRKVCEDGHSAAPLSERMDVDNSDDLRTSQHKTDVVRSFPEVVSKIHGLLVLLFYSDD
jgi:hypothetical protein